MTHPIIEELIRQRSGGEPSKTAAPVRPKSVQARVLLDMLPVVTRANPFKPGDLVEQIGAFSAYTMAEDLVMVTATFEPDLRSAALEGNKTPREDMLILIVVGDDRWAEVCVESWRFQHYSGKVD